MSPVRNHGGFHLASLYKLVIPATCLIFMGWIWMATTGG